MMRFSSSQKHHIPFNFLGDFAHTEREFDIRNIYIIV